MTDEEMDAEVMTDAQMDADMPAGTPNMMRRPKSFTASDVDLGIESPMQSTGALGFALSGPGQKDATLGAGVGPPSEADIQRGLDFTKAHGRPMDPMEADPMAQSVALTTLLGPLGRVLATKLAPTVGAVPASTGVGAAEAYLGAKSAGSDDAGAASLFGGFFGGLGARGAGPNAAAVARNDAQIPKDIKRGATKAPKPMADDVDFRADQLIESSKEIPEVRQALVTKARSNPSAAEATAQRAMSKATADTDAVFDAIEQHHGGLDLQLVTDRLARLEADYHVAGNIPGMEAAGKVLDKLNRHYGGNAGSTLSSAQLRKLRNDLGDLAFPGIAKEARPSGAKQALRDVYDEFNAAVEEVAALTPGVDVSALRARNRQVSSLQPAREALGERASLEADRELGMFGAAKEKVKKGATGINRRLRYGAETHGGDNPVLMAPPSYGPLDNVPTYESERPTPLLPSSLAAQFLINGGMR